MSQDKINLEKILRDNDSIAMLAPSFPLDFEYPAIIGMLRKLGFGKVTELTYGARMVNWWYTEYIKEHIDDQRYFIASPCPTIVAYIEKQFPELKDYLMPYASPMAAMAKIYRKHHPDHKIVFISPCIAKKLIEAPKYPEIDLVLTFDECKKIFEKNEIYAHQYNRHYYFDSLIREYTKIYPVSGGLAKTSHIKKLFKDHEVFVGDGVNHLESEFGKVRAGTSNYRFFDVLNCPGGCIGGPSISRKDLSEKEKKAIILDYREGSSAENMGAHKGTLEYAKDIELKI